jgi:hypothetical protein
MPAGVLQVRAPLNAALEHTQAAVSYLQRVALAADHHLPRRHVGTQRLVAQPTLPAAEPVAVGQTTELAVTRLVQAANLRDVWW